MSWESISEPGIRSYESFMPPGEQILRPEMVFNWPDEITDQYFSMIILKAEMMEVQRLNRS